MEHTVTTRGVAAAAEGPFRLPQLGFATARLQECRLINGLRQGTASAVPESTQDSGFSTPEVRRTNRPTICDMGRWTLAIFDDNLRPLALLPLSNEGKWDGTTRALVSFLTGSASQTEFAVTHSKQKTGTFLTGARTAFKLFKIRQLRTQKPARRGGLARVRLSKRYVTRGFNTFLTETASQTEMAASYRKKTTARFLTETRIAHYRLAAQLSKSHADPVFPSRSLPLFELIGGGNL
jgi:hypothetical protein